MQMDCESIKFAYLSICCACFSFGFAVYFRFSLGFVMGLLSAVVCLWQHILITS